MNEREQPNVNKNTIYTFLESNYKKGNDYE